MRSSISRALPLQPFYLRLRGDCAPLPQAPLWRDRIGRCRDQRRAEMALH
jgi:hypothetical protein